MLGLLLASVIVAGAVGACLHAFATESRAQRRDIEVATAVTKRGVPEWRLMLFDGECDGGSIIVSYSAYRIALIELMPTAAGSYVWESTVEMPDGGGIMSYRWVAASEAAA